jgi:GAF domain-containing protein
MFENSEDLFALLGFTAFVFCYTLNIKLTHLHELQMISSSSSSSHQQYETIQRPQNELSNSLGLNFEDLIQVHAATCNYKELSSKTILCLNDHLIELIFRFLFVSFSFFHVGVVKLILNVSYKLLQAERISVMILSHDKKHLYVAESQDAQGIEVSSDHGISGHVVATGELVNVENAYEDPRFNPEVDRGSGFTTRTLLCAPITINHEVVGVLTALNKVNFNGEITTFSKLDENIIEYLAANAGIAIKKAQLYHQAIRSQRNSAAILSIVRARSSDVSVEKILATTIDTVYELLVPELVSLYLCDQALQEAWICVSKDGLEGLTVPFGHGVAGTVASTGETLRIDNAYEDSRFCQDVDLQTGFRTKSLLCMGVPGFASSSKPIAVIQLINKLNRRGFDEDDEAALTMLCDELSVALRQKVIELSLLRHSNSHKSRPDHIDDTKLEESLLKEYGSVAQRYKYSSSIQTIKLNRMENSPPSPNFIGTPTRRILGPRFAIDEDRVFQEMYRWDLDPFKTRDSDLMRYVEQMFIDFQLIEEFQIDRQKLRNLILGAHALYHHGVIFHNFKHAFSVTHVTYLILRGGAARYLTPLDILATLVSALCHDLDHPGNNNGFEVASKSEIALTHSGDAVLERHHSSTTHRLLYQPENNILENLSRQEQIEVHALITDTIMATDMAGHFYHVETLEISAKSNPHFDAADASSRRALLGHIVHSADLSAQVLCPELALKWGDLVIEEFIHQSNEEKRLNLPLTPFMDGLEDEIKKMRLQHGFIGNIVLPLWTALVGCFPGLSHTVIQCQANYNYINQRIIVLSEQAENKTSDVANNSNPHHRNENEIRLTEIE